MSIFISHSSEDRATALELMQRLRGQNYEAVFLDFDGEHGIAAGKDWEAELYRNLSICRAAIVLLSEKWISSRWCFAEYCLAKMLGKEIFPVQIAPCRTDALLGRLQIVDLYTERESGYGRLWTGLREAGLDPANDFVVDRTRPPYPGLNNFEEEDAGIYFGRDADIKRVLDALTRMSNRRAPPLAVIVGGSGSGKSSLVRAGVIPQLRKNSRSWIVLPPFRPGRNAVSCLARALANTFPKGSKKRAGWEEIQDQVLNGSEVTSGREGRAVSLLRFIADLIKTVVAEDPNRLNATVVVVVDQLEELLSGSGRSAPRNKSAVSETEVFLELLRGLYECADGTVQVLATLRSDFFGAFLDCLRLSGNEFENITLGPMPNDALFQLIEGPAARFVVKLEPALVNRMVSDTGTDDALPLLAFTLREMWEKYRRGMPFTLEVYDKQLGGIQGAVQRVVDEIRIDPSQEPDLRRAFLKMVRVNEDEGFVRQPSRWSELPESAQPLLRQFVEARLLTSDGEKVEVVHESLFRVWRKLAGWLADSREFLLWKKRTDTERKIWENLGFPEAFLLKEGRLAEAERFTGEYEQDSPPELLEFVEKSSNQHQEELDQEHQRRQRELDAARKLTEEQKQRAELSEQREKEQKEAAENLRRAARKLQRRAIAAAAAAAAAVILLIVAVLMWRAAQEQAHRAQEAVLAVQNALTDSFFRTIGVSKENIPMQDEREALWGLAKLDRANAAVRSNLLNRWFGTYDAFMRGEARSGQGFRAATGLNVEYHRVATSKAAELGRSQAAALENLQLTDAYGLWQLGKALAALANKMDPQAAAEIARRGAQRLAAALENPQLTDSFWLLGLGDALAALANKMDPQAAAEIAKGLAAALEKELDFYRLLHLGDALAALGNKMEPQAAAEIARRGAQRLAAALENLQLTDSDRLSTLGNALAALGNKMEPQAAAEIARRGAQRLAAALENPQLTDSYRLSGLGNALAALRNKMEPQAAAEIAKGLAAALENPQETNSYRFSSLGNALAALGNKMDPQAAAEIAKGLAAALENPQEVDFYRLSGLGNALAALANKIEPQAAAEIAKGLAAALENPQLTDSYRLLCLGNALAALANKMDPQAAAEIARRGAQRLAADLENPQLTDVNRLSGLGNALAALANKMDPQAAAEIARRGAQRLAADLENPQLTDSSGLWQLGNALAALANKMDPQAAAEIARAGAQRLAADLENPQLTDSYRLSGLGNALAALANKMDPQAAAEIAKGLAAALENPRLTDANRFSSLGNALAALANKMDSQAAAEIAKGLAAALENPQATDSNRFSSLGNALAALANKMERQAAAEIAKGLAAALENPQATDSNRFSSLGNALAALANKMEPQAAAETARGFAGALENPQETNSDRLSSLGQILATFCRLLPSTHRTHLLALSNMLLRPVSIEATEGKEQPYDRKLLATMCAQLRAEDLAEVLKYPFCTGQAEQIVLNQLKARNVWEFAEQADSLGVKDIDSPAKRPSVPDALKELDALSG